MIWMIVAIAYILIAIVSYYTIFSKWDNNSTFEKIWFSALWICIVPLYIIHWIHNNW